MSAFPHLSNAYHCRNLRLAIEREKKQQNPPGTSGGTLNGLADAVRSIKIPLGIEIAEKFLGEDISTVMSSPPV